MATIARVALAAALLAAATGTPATFDPPFAFPALQHRAKDAGPPTEQSFASACFEFVYGLLQHGGGKALAKPSDLPSAMMGSCLQQDKKGCHRFADQLVAIVQAKEHAPGADHAPAPKASKVATTHAMPQPPAPRPASEAAKHRKAEHKASTHRPGARWTQEELAAEDSLEGKRKLGLLVSHLHGPKRYSDWCSNLYAAATATYVPKKALLRPRSSQKTEAPHHEPAAHAGNATKVEKVATHKEAKQVAPAKAPANKTAPVKAPANKTAPVKAPTNKTALVQQGGMQLEEGRWVVALDRDLKTKMLVQVKHRKAAGIVDPCANLGCPAEISCPAGFTSTKFDGHCCAYCVNPNVPVEKEAVGATGNYGGKASAMPDCANVWCFPTLCTGTLTNPTTTNGQCCPSCNA